MHPRHKFWQQLAVALLLALAVLSVAQGGRNALRDSRDFQWEGAHLLLQHVDPWQEYLAGDPQHYFQLKQIPTYLPILYLLLAPIGLVSYSTAKAAWLLCNLLFATTSAIVAARFYGFRAQGTLLILSLLLLATATRNTLGNGQNGLLVLLLWTISLLAVRVTKKRAVAAGVSYFKLNFAPPVFLYLLLRGGVARAAISLLPWAISFVFAWAWIGGPFLTLLLEPVRVARTGYYPNGGGANLMDALQLPLRAMHVPDLAVQVSTFAVALAITAAVLWLAIARSPNLTGWHMALAATMSYSLYKHHAYDAVVLLLPLCFALARWRSARGKAALALIAYLWYGQRVVDAATGLSNSFFVLQFVLLMALLAVLWQMGEREEMTAR